MDDYGIIINYNRRSTLYVVLEVDIFITVAAFISLSWIAILVDISLIYPFSALFFPVGPKSQFSSVISLFASGLSVCAFTSYLSCFIPFIQLFRVRSMSFTYWIVHLIFCHNDSFVLYYFLHLLTNDASPRLRIILQPCFCILNVWGFLNQWKKSSIQKWLQKVVTL